MKNLINQIKQEQIKYHIKGERVKYDLESSHETKNGKIITYTAKRDDGERGLCYIIHKHEASIKDGCKDIYIGYTSQFERESVSIWHNGEWVTY